MSENEQKQGFKVNDRRRFDESGNEKGPESSTAPYSENRESPGTARPTPRGPEPKMNRTSDEETQDTGEFVMENEAGSTQDHDPSQAIGFQTFTMSLAHQALMLLGEVPGPDGSFLTPDKQAARQSIEILAMLERKTKGNLTAEEQGFLEEVLHELRLRFVRTT